MTPMERALRPVRMAGRSKGLDALFRPWLESTCTDVAVRTHVPVQIGLDAVLIPIEDATEVMRSIAAAVWPDDPSPMEESAYVSGYASASQPVLDAIQILAAGDRDDPARWQQEQALDVLDPGGLERLALGHERRAS